MYFLDTNIVNYLRFGNARVEARLSAAPGAVYISSIVVEEILATGFIAEINKIRSRRSKADLERTHADFLATLRGLARYNLLPYTHDAEAIYTTFRTAKLKGMDGRIAAHALALGFVLVTENIADFALPGLTVEDWTR